MVRSGTIQSVVCLALTAMAASVQAVEPPVLNPPVTYFTGAGTGPNSVTFADFDGDGDDDGAATLFGTNDIQLLRNTGAGYVVGAAFFATGTEPYSILTTDFNVDGWPDIAWLNHGSSEFAVARNAGTGVLGTSFPVIDIYGAPAQCHSLTSGDFDGDGFPDMAAADYIGDQVVVRRNDGTGQFPGGMIAYGLPPIGGMQPEWILTADMDGNNTLDLVTANAMTDNVSILWGTGLGTFIPFASFPVGGMEPLSVAVGDYNGDGRPDIAAACNLTDDVNILFNAGAGGLLPAVPYWLNASGVEQEPQGIDAADMDCDGDIDLATANGLTNNVSILTNDGGGVFVQQPPVPTTPNPAWITLADLDGGTLGLPEIVTADFAGNSITVQVNVTKCYCEGDANGDLTVDPLDLGYIGARFGCPVGTGLPDCDAADVNGDGVVDPLDGGFAASRFGPCP